MSARSALVAMLLIGSPAALAQDGGPSPLERQGQALAEQMCASCHSIGRSGRSLARSGAAFPGPGAEAGSRRTAGTAARFPHSRASGHADISIHA